jgi:alpha-beta hydrolase superfamily lysophospholipase
MQRDPLATLGAVKVPSLVLYGSDDPWVPVAISAERLQQVARPTIEIAIIARADHEMATTMSAEDQIDPALRASYAPDSAEYFARLAAWLAKQGPAKN